MKGLEINSFHGFHHCLTWHTMKKSLIIGLVSFASAIASLGQGTVDMDNYNYTPFPIVTYGSAGIPRDGVSGTFGTDGGGLQVGWTAGLYYAVGDVTASVAADPTGYADPSALGGGLILGSGPGSTVPLFASSGLPGYFVPNALFSVPNTSAAGGDTVTLMVIAYNSNSGSYANANWRGHSAAFTMTTSSSSPIAPRGVGATMPPFSVFAVPEPSVFALGALGALALLRLRRYGN